jgi:hypothetical protein
LLGTKKEISTRRIRQAISKKKSRLVAKKDGTNIHPPQKSVSVSNRSAKTKLSDITNSTAASAELPVRNAHSMNTNGSATSKEVASGRAVPLPPLVNDIADTLYWLQDIESPMHLRCIYNVVARNLLRVCILDEEHNHPL